MRHILHVDMDAFYASVEQHDDPCLRGIPVIVGADPQGGHGRGVVAACSYEARNFGVHSALPIRQAWRRCPQGVFLRPRMARYRAVSATIMGIFRETTELVEPLSIDEAFLDITGSTRLLGSPESIAGDLRQAILERTGLTASVGLAPNKFVAKIASDLRKPDGFVVVSGDRVREFLAPLPIRRLWGVGPRTGLRLEEMGIHTIGQIAAVAPQEIAKKLGPHGENLRALAEGRDNRPVIPERNPKSISNETTFAEDTCDVGRLRDTIRRLSDQVAGRLRDQGYRGRTATLKLRYSSFATYTRRISSSRGFSTGNEITALLFPLFEQFDLAEPVRLIGIGASSLIPDEGVGSQPSLFAVVDRGGHLSQVVDTLRQRYGEGSVQRASDLPER